MPDSKRKAGRPVKKHRVVQFGLRILCKDEESTHQYQRPWKQVKTPLGDKNMISMQIDASQCYESLLQMVKDAFFPDGVNRMVGDIGSYHGFEIVNGQNDNVRDGIVFTLSTYIEKKMVSGSVRLYLLLAEEASLDDDLNEMGLLGDPDYLPDLPCVREVLDNGTYVASSPSGEVLIKASLLVPPSTMSTRLAAEPCPSGSSTEGVGRPPSTRTATEPCPGPSTERNAAYRRHL
jgi:hypothetical protein